MSSKARSAVPRYLFSITGHAALACAGFALAMIIGGCAPSAAPGVTPAATARVPTPAATATASQAADPRALLPSGATALSDVRADLDGDGKLEVAVLGAFGYQADRLSADHLELFVFAPSAGAYAEVWRSDPLLGERAEALRAVDVNKDGRTEVVSVQSMGAAGESMYVFGAQGTSYAALAPKGGFFDGRASFGEAAARLEDLDGDGALEVLAGYGPAASRTEVYRWNGKAYAFLFTHQDPESAPMPVARVAGTVASVAAGKGTATLLTANGATATMRLQPTTQATTTSGNPAALASLAPGTQVEAFGGRAADGTLVAEALIITEGKMETAQPADLNLSLLADKNQYLAGDTVRLTFTVANPGATPVSLDFSSGQQFDLAIVDATGQEVWRWSRGKLFTQAFTKLQLQPGEKKSFEGDWQAEGPAGRYQAKGWLTTPGATMQATATFALR